MKTAEEKSTKQNHTGTISKQDIYQKNNGQRPLAFIDRRKGSASRTELQAMVAASPHNVDRRKRL